MDEKGGPWRGRVDHGLKMVDHGEEGWRTMEEKGGTWRRMADHRGEGWTMEEKGESWRRMDRGGEGGPWRRRVD
ncbi:hypothetical protein LSAT2_018606, partial [Lamellibrachia satsuma]